MKKPLIRIAVEWAIRCFGVEHVTHIPTRAMRVAEEAIELAQAAQVDKETIYRIVDAVYAKPRGNLDQEIGGVMLTLAIFSNSAYVDPNISFETELCRVLRMPPEHFAARNQSKVKAGFGK